MASHSNSGAYLTPPTISAPLVDGRTSTESKTRSTLSKFVEPVRSQRRSLRGIALFMHISSHARQLSSIVITTIMPRARHKLSLAVVRLARFGPGRASFWDLAGYAYAPDCRNRSGYRLFRPQLVPINSPWGIYSKFSSHVAPAQQFSV